MSAMFLTRRLAMWNHLEVEQLPKEGLRYWFSNEKVRSHADASETGGFLRSAVPSFQLRRDALDEHLLATAVVEGATLVRPARVGDVFLGDLDHQVTFEHDGRSETVTCRWVLDATGKATFLGKRLGLIDRNEEHPTAAIWCRWKNACQYRRYRRAHRRWPCSSRARLAPALHQSLHGIRLLDLGDPARERQRRASASSPRHPA